MGGSNKDEGKGIAIDSSGNAYVTGNTSSTNFPTVNPIQPAFAGGFSDAFVAKINPDGTALVYSTYLGGSTYPDSGYAIAVDSFGNAYVTGETRSGNFPTKNPLQPKFGGGGGYDAFVSKVDPRGALIYSTYLGGRGNDSGYAIAVNSMGSAVVTGLVSSSNFPKVNPIRSDLNGGADAFVAKIDPTGSELVYSTYLGGSGFEQGSGIAIDSSGNAYITGQTSSTDFPTANPFQKSLGGGVDAFVVKLGLKGKLIYSTYLGGRGHDYGNAIAVGPSSDIYITGKTDSTNFPILNTFQQAFGGRFDAFIAKIADTRPAGEKGE